MMRMVFGWSARFVGVLVLGGLCGACSSVESVIPTSIPWEHLFPGEGAPPEPGTAAAPSPPTGGGPEVKQIDCPEIEVLDGTSAMRVGGDANASVRYQFDITKTARECRIQGNQFAIKVGVAGRLLIGPAGSAGVYSAPLRIVVRDDATQKPVTSKIYRVEATATAANNLQASFQLVAEPVLLPYVHQAAIDDYTVLVGFDNGHSAPVEKRARRRHKN